MSRLLKDYQREFHELVGDLTETMREIADPVAIAAMLYAIAEERRGGNLVLRDINAKFDQILEKLGAIDSKLGQFLQLLEPRSASTPSLLTERDKEVLRIVVRAGKLCAEDLKQRFSYRGKNAATARLSKLHRLGFLRKVHVGKKVFYEALKPALEAVVD